MKFDSRSLRRFAKRRSHSTRSFRIADQTRFRNLHNTHAPVRLGITSHLALPQMLAPASPCLSTAGPAVAASAATWPLFLHFQRRFLCRHVRVLSTAAAPIRWSSSKSRSTTTSTRPRRCQSVTCPTIVFTMIRITIRFLV